MDTQANYSPAHKPAPNSKRAHAALVLLLAAGGLVAPARALENGLARTPPMGWLAWERFVCELDCAQNPGECIDAGLFSAMATRLAEDGYKAAGYEYVNIDDCWSLKQRQPQTNRLLADPARFPDSIGPLAAHVHSLGLKLGIYGDCGTQTCQGFPGQLQFANNLTGNHFQLDAEQFARWQLDSFKFDGCSLEVARAAHLCPLMGAALNATGRPMLFSCSWPAYENEANLPTDWPLVAERCNLWRAFGDIEDSWKSVLETVDWFVRKQALVVRFHGPGQWFDADQLVIGNFGLSHSEEQAQMAVWCVWAAPLFMSNDLRRISKQSQRLLRNPHAIAVNQDKLGVFGLMVAEARELQAFVKPIEPVDARTGCPSYALVYLDRRALGNGRAASFGLAALLGRLHALLAEASPRWLKWAHCAGQNHTGLAPAGQLNSSVVAGAAAAAAAAAAATTFSVFDVFDNNAQIFSRLRLANDSLRLRVEPSGARFVTLLADG